MTAINVLPVRKKGRLLISVVSKETVNYNKYRHLYRRGFQVSARKEIEMVESHVCQTVIPKSLGVYKRSMISARSQKESDRVGHTVLITSPMNA